MNSIIITFCFLRQTVRHSTFHSSADPARSSRIFISCGSWLVNSSLSVQIRTQPLLSPVARRRFLEKWTNYVIISTKLQPMELKYNFDRLGYTAPTCLSSHGIPAISQNEISWFFHDSRCIFHNLYGMKMAYCTSSMQKHLKSSMPRKRKKKSTIFSWCILKFHDFSMILGLFFQIPWFFQVWKMILPFSMIFPWRWKPWVFYIAKTIFKSVSSLVWVELGGVH